MLHSNMILTFVYASRLPPLFPDMVSPENGPVSQIIFFLPKLYLVNILSS